MDPVTRLCNHSYINEIHRYHIHFQDLPDISNAAFHFHGIISLAYLPEEIFSKYFAKTWVEGLRDGLQKMLAAERR